MLKDSFDDNDWERSVITFLSHILKHFLIAWTIDYKISVSWFFSWGINPFFESVEMNKVAISMIRISLGDRNWKGNITLHANSKPCVIELEYCDISVLNKFSKSFYMLKMQYFFFNFARPVRFASLKLHLYSFQPIWRLDLCLKRKIKKHRFCNQQFKQSKIASRCWKIL